MKNTVIFDKSLKNEILSVFDKVIDKEGFIAEKAHPSQRVLSPDGEEVNIEEFAGIAHGSELFIKSDLISLITISKKGNEHGVA